ncbi:CHAT domain-containing protein [Desertifilum sp. FACHB-1129]|uniref:FHA domain-containing protein n=1 Tax=Desertifilum tharense IPPAS B-1220 TaxID=1781255 RepID=A0A1E5QPL4_9CYAN|nr:MULTISPECIES: CHAT domain-containing protein [Desertifilum]MDA0209814.1 CHAT domain-containing protein [Cyanobacteria bacterium FC1]MDI9635967.1 CHAT domain-containing protein [Geitlerinema splendidum]MBD2310695.1 CHAT domain-containing protein [Desertifilum sp. FACHB-1129]MBD2320732.1 CHAT domain-containing protein [Desertifilum sp. FACHB-866]MBD2330860.1 CHAT domain-containing protein [Desertifilum sp. FACHB-868]
MSQFESPCLSIAIARLMAAAETISTHSAHFAIWVIRADYPGGYVHHDCLWPEHLSQTWQAWQEMFHSSGAVHGLQVPPVNLPQAEFTLAVDSPPGAAQASYSSRLMQQLGIHLWQWVFHGPIQSSLSHSQGIAIGQSRQLRLRLEVRDPNLIALPWEIMQPQAGKQAISLSQQILFSRTTSDVDPLPPRRTDATLNILLVFGQDSPEHEAQRTAHQSLTNGALDLAKEAEALAQTLENSTSESLGMNSSTIPVAKHVDTLIQPTPEELIEQLEAKPYNILFYGGHGVPSPDGGLLFLRPNTTLSGTELAQVLTRCRVTLAVFNACWGAQPDRHGDCPIPRSSLAEVLLHHGVPAVLGMRDSIADREALTFIQAFAQALADRLPIDQAVAVARQQLLTIYKFNQPAWTLPVLYMHPEFDGELIPPLEEGVTELPENSLTWMQKSLSPACLRSLGETEQVWPVRGGLMRVGRLPENDIVIQERWVSQRHAEIICRDPTSDLEAEPTYWLRDFSRYGTLISGLEGWKKIHHQEVPLQSGVKLKFGSSQGQTLEFIVERP